MRSLAQQRASSLVLRSLWLVVVAGCAVSTHDSTAVTRLDEQSVRIRDVLLDTEQGPLSGLELCARAHDATRTAGPELADALTFQGLRVRYETEAAVPKGASLISAGKQWAIASQVGNSVLLKVDQSQAHAVAKALIEAEGVRAVTPECAVTLSSRSDRCEPIRLPTQQQNKPNDLDPRLWGHRLIGYSWDVASRSAGVEVAVFDSGVDCRHAELSDQFWPAGAGENASADASRVCPKFAGYDYVDMDDDAGHCRAADGKCNDHGTAMAGVIAARGNNGIGAVGVAPGALIRSYRVLATDKKVGPIANFERAILDAHRSGTRVFSFSIYGEASLKAVCDELDRVSTGTDAALVNILGRQDGTYLVGCAPDAPRVLVVAGVSRNAQTGTLSLPGDTDGAELYAPAEFVWGTGISDGSSNAVAYVSGAAAQLWGTRAFATCSALQMRKLLLGSAQVVTECTTGEPVKLLSLAFLPAIADRSFASCDEAIEAALDSH